MPIAFDRLWRMRPFANPTAFVLSTLRGVGVWGWPSSSRVTRIGHASRATRNAAPTSASIAELMMLDMILAKTLTGPFVFGALEGAVSVVRELFGWCLGLPVKK